MTCDRCHKAKRSVWSIIDELGRLAMISVAMLAAIYDQMVTRRAPWWVALGIISVSWPAGLVIMDEFKKRGCSC